MKNTIGAIFLAAAVLAAPLAISLTAVASSESIPLRIEDALSDANPAGYREEFFEYE